MATTIDYRFVVKRDLAANFTAANTLLLQGEFALETDTNMLKMGDGSTPWNTLAYWLPGQLSKALDKAFGSTQGMLLYRDASAWKALAAGTTGQVLQSGGVAANPSWATPASGGGSSSGGSVYSRPALSTFSWLNQGTASAVDHTSGPLSMISPINTTSAQLRVLAITPNGGLAAASSFSLVVKLSGLISSAANIGSPSLIAYNSTSGRTIRFNSGYVELWNSLSSYSGGTGSASPISFGTTWQKINFDGTTLKFYASQDGWDWILQYSATATAWITGGVTHIGFGVNAYSSTSNAPPTMMTVLDIWSFVNGVSDQTYTPP